MRPAGPYSIPVFNRENAAGKSTLARILRLLIMRKSRLNGPLRLFRRQAANPYQRARYVGNLVASRVVRISQAPDRNAVLVLNIY
jgi:hypothetical protein